MTLNNRTHFFAVAARLMRQILVDHVRRRSVHPVNAPTNGR